MFGLIRKNLIYIHLKGDDGTAMGGNGVDEVGVEPFQDVAAPTTLEFGQLYAIDYHLLHSDVELYSWRILQQQNTMK